MPPENDGPQRGWFNWALGLHLVCCGGLLLLALGGISLATVAAVAQAWLPTALALAIPVAAIVWLRSRRHPRRPAPTAERTP